MANDSKDPEPSEAGAPPTSVAGSLPEERKSPYSTLWMPLVVVPAGIVLVLVLVFLMFGGIAGGPTSISDNLHNMVQGGKNEREQAAFHLTQKVAENSVAALDGRETPWPVPEDFGQRLHAAWDTVPADDLQARFLLASLLAETDDPEGLTLLVEILEGAEGQDPENQLRFQILAKLGAIGDARALPAVLAYAQSEDAGLRSLVAIVLQKMPADESLAALTGLLHDHELEVRANAAISLSKLGDDRGAEVLFQLLEPEVFEAEHAAHSRRFRGPLSISESRRSALRALARLGREGDRQRVETWLKDPDLEFRAGVIDSLADWGAAGSADRAH
jgi:HEAT repeat protein